MTEGIKDRVAVVGAGCTSFGTFREKDAYDLLVESVDEALEDAGRSRTDLEAGWIGNFYPHTGNSGATLVDALKTLGIPSTRVENYCASGMDAFRNACYAVAAGAHDLVLVAGVEKLSDLGGTGIPSGGGEHPVLPSPSAPGLFAMTAVKSMDEYGWDREDLARVAVKNHENGTHHPKAHFRKEVSVEDVLSAPPIAEPLGRLDCSAVSDGAAALLLASESVLESHRFPGEPVRVKGLANAVTSDQPHFQPDYEFNGFPATRQAARVVYEKLGIEHPARDLDLFEIHDCFTITELLTLGDLGLCEYEEAPQRVASGETRVDGSIPVNPSGGLKSFGHPIGATGCRMIYEVVRQIQGRADGLQVKGASRGLAHNLGGPGSVSSICVLGQ